MKRCSLCGEWRPQEEFYAHPMTDDRLQSQCKRCIKVSKKIRRKVYQRIANDSPVNNILETAGVTITGIM